MPDVSLHGRVAPKSKSINVEANLLSERLETQRKVRDFVRTRTAALFGVLLLGCLALPPIHRFYRETRNRFHEVSAQEGLLAKRVDALKQQEDSVKPAEQDLQAIGQIHGFARQFLGQTILFLNQVNPQLYLTNLTIDASNRTMKFTAQAEAQNYDAARGFMTDLGAADKNDKSSQITLLQMNADSAVWQTGVSFNFERKTTLGAQ